MAKHQTAQALVEYTLAAVLLGGMVAVSFQQLNWREVLSQYAANGSHSVVSGSQLEQPAVGVAQP
mgnify:CR=1 FL=1